MKMRSLVSATIAIAALTVAVWGVVPYWAGAQDRPVGLYNFNDFVCPDECAINADVCCAYIEPIVIEVDR